MPAEIFFITGTNTEVGKTYITTHLLKEYKKQNKVAIALKPIASGAEYIDNQLVNEDALLIKEYNSLNLDYKEINPFTFKEAIAPHIAAKNINKELNINRLVNTISDTISVYKDKTDYILIEGAGGFLTPINYKNTYAEVVKKLSEKFSIKIILVVNIKLGCINHSMLTSDYLINNNYNFYGWVANNYDKNNLVLLENIKTIEKFLKAPLLFNVPRL